MPKFDWTRTAMPSSLLLSPEGSVVEPYSVKESCKEAPYILYGLFASLRHARLTTIKSAFGLDIIECLHLFVKINLDLGSQASIPFLYETQLLFSFKISLLLFGFLVIRYKYEITKRYLSIL